MKVVCVAQCFHNNRTYLPGERVNVSNLNLIPPQHFSTVAGEPLVTKSLTKEGEWLVDPKTGKPLDGQTTGAEDTVQALTVPQIKAKLDELKAIYSPSLKRDELLALLEEIQEDALSE